MTTKEKFEEYWKEKRDLAMLAFAGVDEDTVKMMTEVFWLGGYANGMRNATNKFEKTFDTL